MRRCLSRLAILLLAAGCATTANYEKILDGWVGAPADRLVESWGAPARTFRMANGNEIYIYEQARSGAISTPVQVHQSPGMFIGNTYFPGNTTVTGGQVIPIHRACRTEFTVAGGTVTNWRYEGNACVARAPDEASLGSRAVEPQPAVECPGTSVWTGAGCTTRP